MTAGEMNWGRIEMTGRQVNYGGVKPFASPVDWERFAAEHPRLVWLVLLVGAPCGVLAAVVGVAGAVMLPLSLLFGWAL